MKQPLLVLFGLLALMSVAISCDDPLPQLPPETTEGRNTFGCLINGELVISDDYPSILAPPLLPSARLNQAGDTLTIIGYGQQRQYFVFTVAQPTLETRRIDELQYVFSSDSLSIQATAVDGIQFTRMDQEAGVVSGTFAFQMKRADGKTMVVSQGRFDMNMYRSSY